MKEINAKSEKQREYAEEMREKAIELREEFIEQKAGLVEMLKEGGNYEGGRIQEMVEKNEAEIEWLKNCSNPDHLISIGKCESEVGHFAEDIDL